MLDILHTGPLLDQPSDLAMLGTLRERVAQQMREADAAEAAAQAVLEVRISQCIQKEALECMCARTVPACRGILPGEFL